MNLEKKIVRYIITSILIFISFITFWVILKEKKHAISLETRNIEFTAKNIVNKYNYFFNDLATLASSLNKNLTKSITGSNIYSKSLIDSYSMKRSIDGAIRCDDGISGAFLAKSSELNPSISNYFFLSKLAFELLGPIAKTHFENFYFISKDDFERISPKEWALEVDYDHNFENDVVYKIAVPENNPEKIAKWTPLYYDAILKEWMTSIIIPVYNSNEFLGVTGNDIFLSSIFDNIMNLDIKSKLFHAVLFDSNGNLIAYPKYKNEILSETAEMNTLLNINKFEEPVMAEIINRTIHNVFSNETAMINVEQGCYYFSSQKIPAMNWYLSVYISKSDTLKKFNIFIIKILCIAITFALGIFLVFYLYLKSLILKRIATLGIAISKITSGNLNSKIKILHNDEIGILESGFNDMQLSITNQFQQLNVYKNNLETLVNERTTELAEKNIELERFNKLFVDREFRIKELRDKVKELEGKLVE